MTSAEQFSASNVDPFWFENPERHAIAMREALEPVTFVSVEGQRFSGIYLNRDFSEQTLIVRLGAWFNSTTTEQQKYTAYQYAAANPENPIILIDMPSHGNSDPLTLAQRIEVFHKRQISKIAHAQAEAMCAFLGTDKEIVAAGDSLGALASLDFVVKAGRIGLRPLLILGFDMAGVDKRTSFDMAKVFFRYERRRQSRYHEGEDNVKMDRAYDRFKEELIRFGYDGKIYNPLAVYKRDPVLAALLFTRSPLASDKGFTVLERALEANHDMSATLVSGGLSRLSRWRKIEPRALELCKNYGKRLTWEVWPNDSHAMGIAEQQPRFAAYTRTAIIQRAAKKD